MTKPTFVQTLGKTKHVPKGTSLVLDVKVSSPEDVHFKWTRNTTEVVLDAVGAAAQSYKVSDPGPANAGKYAVSAWRGNDDVPDMQVSGGECEVTIEGAEPPEPLSAPQEWDAQFAGRVFKYAGWSGAGMLLIVLLAAVLARSIAWTVAIGLLAIAAVLAAAGVAVAMIDLRGRARAAHVVAGDARALGADTLKATAEVLKAWGGLGLASAMLVLVAISLIGATVIGYRSLPDPGGSTATPSSSPSASVTPSTTLTTTP